MGILAGESISPSDFIELKEKIKDIMLNKRIYYGSLKEYGGKAYDYNTIPVANGEILAEHQSKIVEPMRAITTNNVDAIAKENDKIISLYNISTIIDGFGAKTATSSINDCQNYCSGLCVTQCSVGCSGCDGCSGCGSGCASGCSGCQGCSGCGSGCASTCSGGCKGTCKGCSSTCTGKCDTGCAGCSGDCRSVCAMSCSDSCGRSCSGECYGNCTGCTGGCQGGCSGCSGSCSNICSLTCGITTRGSTDV